jgi:hypothetical protein
VDETTKVKPDQVIFSPADDRRNLALAIMLWQRRIENPELTVEITPADVESLKACAEYLGVTPMVRIYRPVQVAAQTLRPGFYVQLVDEGGSTFKAIESDEKEFDRSQAAAKWRQAKDSLPDLCRTVLAGLARGETSDFVIKALCEAAMLVAQTPVPR